MITTKYLAFTLLLFFIGCQNNASSVQPWTAEETAQLYRSPLFFIDSIMVLEDPVLQKIVRGAMAIWQKQPPFLPTIDEAWAFGEGNPANGLNVSYTQKPDLDSTVNLPHRIAKPNWPFWYEKKIVLPTTAWLYANGDDGVQVFLDGQIQQAQRGVFYKLPESADSIRVTIRVLNNAMSGGLRKVALIETQAFQDYSRNRNVFLLTQEVLWKYLKYPGLVAADSILLALESQNLDLLSALSGQYPSLVSTTMPTALPEISAPFSFTAWGDSQGGWRTFQQLIDLMREEPSAFSIGLGDLVSEGVDELEWLAYSQCLQPLIGRHPVFSVAGNHDYDGYYNDLIPVLYKKTTLPDPEGPSYFSWQHGNAFFLALDPNETFPLALDGAQKEWVLEQLQSEAWKAAEWRFVLIHQPPYAQGWPGYHGDDFVREFIDSVAEARQVDFVLSGHTHDYERLTKTYGNQRTHFFILGGAGGGLEPVESSDFPEMDLVRKEHHFARFAVFEDTVKIKVINAEGQLIDSMTAIK